MAAIVLPIVGPWLVWVHDMYPVCRHDKYLLTNYKLLSNAGIPSGREVTHPRALGLWLLVPAVLGENAGLAPVEPGDGNNHQFKKLNKGLNFCKQHSNS